MAARVHSGKSVSSAHSTLAKKPISSLSILPRSCRTRKINRLWWSLPPRMWSRFAFIAADRRLISKLTSAANAFIKRQDWPPHENGNGRSNRNRLARRPRRWRRHDGFFCLEESANDRVKILDTRKTTPGLRALEKAAVVAGGGANHRFGLFDMVLLKDNHLTANTGFDAFAKAVHKVREARPNVQIEVEADTLEQVR